ncbi:Uncharacterized protein FWK35_00006581 [Aphis craccivora]|uniref:Uncharacterized protein n=1 Tax=Aphis craccivora TaxID=307492 RepID=A0A6G0ZM21_APHCR|nr:Uncharacterized protein FWK35_00006581 [Aphis craccivora]
MTIASRNNAPISNFGVGFRWKNEYDWCIIEVKSKHFPTVFKKIEKNKKKMMEKRTIEIFDFFSNFYEICRKRENLQYKFLKILSFLIMIHMAPNMKFEPFLKSINLWIGSE